MKEGEKPVIVQRQIEVKTTKKSKTQHTQTKPYQQLDHIENQLNIISTKLKQLNNKKWTTKQSEWKDLTNDLNEVLSMIKFKEIKQVFERKFEQEIRLLNDFHLRKYRQSMFRCCFLCCPNWMLRRLKNYKLVDERFQKAVSQVQKIPRTIYFYTLLLYVKLFMILVTLNKIENHNQKILAPSQQTDNIKKAQQQQFNKLKESDDNIIQVVEHNIIIDSQQYKQRLQKIKASIQQIMDSDWKEIINIEEWCSFSYKGFIQINTDAPIQTFLEFKDCKLKTNHLFQQISSTSFDLRTVLVRKSKSSNRSYQYVLEFFYSDSLDFQFRFWLADNQNTPQNRTNVQKYILLAMRIGIKQKLLRTANLQYKQKATHWIIHNYVHINQKISKEHIKSHHHLPQSEIQSNESSESSYQSVSESESMDKQKFWWINYRQELIKAIVQVSKQKKLQKGSPKLRKQQFTKHNKPQANNDIKDNPQKSEQKEKGQSQTTTKQNRRISTTTKQSKFKQLHSNKDKKSKTINPQQQQQNMQSIDRLVAMSGDSSYQSYPQQI